MFSSQCTAVNTLSSITRDVPVAHILRKNNRRSFSGNVYTRVNVTTGMTELVFSLER